MQPTLTVWRIEHKKSQLGPYNHDLSKWIQMTFLLIDHKPPEAFDNNCSNWFTNHPDARFAWATYNLAYGMVENPDHWKSLDDMGFHIVKIDVNDEYMVLPDGQVMFVDPRLI